VSQQFVDDGLPVGDAFVVSLPDSRDFAGGSFGYGRWRNDMKLLSAHRLVESLDLRRKLLTGWRVHRLSS